MPPTRNRCTSPAPSSSRRAWRRRSSARCPGTPSPSPRTGPAPPARLQRVGRVRAARLPRRRLPAAAGAGSGARLHARPQGCRRHHRAGRARRLTRRVASRADRRPRALRGPRADDGRHRLLPPRRARAAAGGRRIARAARGHRPGPRAGRRSRASPGRARATSRSSSRTTSSASASTACSSPPAASTASSRTSARCCPDSHTHELTLPRGELLDIVRRVGIFARQNAPVRVRVAAGELTISAQTPDVGEARESLPTAFNDEPFEIGFNPDYLRDGIEAVGGRRARAAPDLAAAARAAQGSRRRLLVPAHADPTDLGGSPDCASIASGPSPSAATRRLETGLAPGTTLVAGPNGAGKTSLLEARARGARRRRRRAPRPTSRCIREGEAFLRVEAEGEQGGRPASTSVAIAPGEPKRITIDGAPVRSADDARRALRVRRVPAGAPRRREARARPAPRLRRSRGRPPVARLRPHQQRLRRRPRAARRVAAPHPRRPRVPGRASTPGTSSCAQAGAVVAQARQRFCERAEPLFQERLGLLGGRGDDASLRYRTAWPSTVDGLRRGAGRAPLARPRAADDVGRAAPGRRRAARAGPRAARVRQPGRAAHRRPGAAAGGGRPAAGDARRAARAAPGRRPLGARRRPPRAAAGAAGGARPGGRHRHGRRGRARSRPRAARGARCAGADG